MEESEIKEEWAKYYNYLEDLRQSGVTNMFGAVPFLTSDFNIDKELATKILSNWMHNYSALKEKYGWAD